MRVQCDICPHGCSLEDGHLGFCGARRNIDGKITCSNYGEVSSMALDPIEKKPLHRYMPGSSVLSVGSYGCNLRCPFCQNCDISMADGTAVITRYFSPRQLIDKALELRPKGNIGIAYTYNEPVIGYEYVFDCARLAHDNELKNILVTNGYICQEPLRKILPLIDAMNIDLKGFTDAFYRKLSGDLETVKQTIATAAQSCHIEVTTLIIPNENDSDEEMSSLSKWLSVVNPDIPLHLSRFFPRYKYAGQSPTPPETLYRLRDIAKQNLHYVYLGNL